MRPAAPHPALGGADFVGAIFLFFEILNVSMFWCGFVRIFADFRRRVGGTPGLGGRPGATAAYAMLLNSASASNGSFRDLPGAPGGASYIYIYIYMKTQHLEAPGPAAPRRAGPPGFHVLCFHMYEAAPGPPENSGRPALKRKHY
jgi:hypothetical protein